MNIPAQPATERRPRKQPQPRNFKEFIICFSDGTFILADPSDIVEKSKQAVEEIQKPENAGKLTFEIRGLSRKIIDVYRKSIHVNRVQVNGNTIATKDSDSGEGTLTIKYED